MAKSCKFDAFKLRGDDFLMITLSNYKDVETVTYEILGDRGTHIEKKIVAKTCDNYITERICDTDETLVFKYTVNENDMDFHFINYEELMDVENESEKDILSNAYSVDKNIHMRIEKIETEEVTDSSSIETLELEPGECMADCLDEMEEGDDNELDDYDMDEMAMMGFDVESGEIMNEDDDDLYKPVSDEEDMDGSIFHMEDGVDITDLEEIEDAKVDSDTPPGWNIMRPEPIKIDDSKKETVDVDNEMDQSVKNIEIDEADI